MSPRGKRILIVDDEENICKSCLKILSKERYQVDYTLSGYQALEMIHKEGFDVVITDLKMSSLGGMELLRRVKGAHPDTMVIVITGYATVSSAVEVMKLGAFDYLPKPFTPDELRTMVRQALAEKENRRQNRVLMDQTAHPRPLSHQLIGDSPKIKKVIGMIKKVAPTDSTVLIYGESGTGKELVARAIHANSQRKDEVFFAVDCGTLSGNLLESELFGHVRGAFTGAHKDKDGIFKLANDGTVFLDEISNVTPEVQSKLLRFLESREFLPLGATSTLKVQVRLIFATNRDLEEMVHEGSFRQDFYYRIFVYPIMLPPLRERTTDIMPIAYHFLNTFSRDMGKEIRGFADEAANTLKAYHWPGNVRQLRNVVERAVILCEGEMITRDELPFLGDVDTLMENIPTTNEELKQAKKEIRRRAVDKVEKNFVFSALSRNNWNVTRAAKEVGIQRTNFQKLIKKHDIRIPSRLSEQRLPPPKEQA
jgi:DNA-binding NtrC family response regulator